MARTTDVLQIKLEVQGDGTVKARLLEVGEAGEKAGKGARSASGGVKMLGDAVAAFGVAKMVTGLIQINREAEMLRVSLRTLEGSQAAATERFVQLQEVAKTTPLSVNQVTETYIKLKNFGFDPLNGSMQAMIDQSAALGGGYDTLSAITLQLGQAMAKGKLQSQEMNILIERGVPVTKLLADAMDTTTDAVADLASKGKLGRDAVQMLIEQMGKANFGAAAAQANTLDGAIGALQDNIEQLAIAVGDSGLAAAFTEMVRDVAEGIGVLADLISETDDAGDSANFLGQVLQTLGRAMDVVRTAAKIVGINIGALIDYFLGVVEAATSASHSLVGYYEALKAVTERDFSGARAAIAAGHAATADAFVKAEQRMANAIATSKGMTTEAVKEMLDAWAELKKGPEDFTPAVQKAGRDGKTALTELSEATKAVRTEADRLIAALARQVSEHGKTEQQILAETVARLKLTGATQQQIDLLERLLDARRKQIAADEEQARRDKEAERILQDAIRATDELMQLRREQATIIGGPVVEANQRYAAVLAVIAAAEQALLDLGPPTLEQIEAIAQARADAATINAKETQDAERSARDMALRQVQGYGAVWLQGISDLGPAITDGLMSGEWEDVGKRLGRSILGGLLDTLMDQAVVQPLQNAFLNIFQSSGQGGFSGFLGSFFGGGSGGSIAGGGAAGGGGMFGGAGGALMSNPVGWIAAGMMLNRSLYNSGWSIGESGNSTSAIVGSSIDPAAFVTAITAVTMDRLLQGLGMSGSAAALFSGSAVFARLFGRKAPEVTASGISGQYGFGGFEGESFADIYQRGGVFRSSRRWTETGEMDAGVDRVFDRVIAQLRRGVEQLADSLGTDISAALDALRFDARLELSDDPEEAKKQIEQYVQDMLDQLSQAALDALGYGNLPDLAGLTASEALAGLQDLTTYISELESRLDQLDSSPLVQLRIALDALAKSESDAMLALEDALSGFDPAEIAAAAASAEAAIVQRYNTEIQMVQQLEAALLSAQQQARQMDLMLAQRIAGLTGDYTDAVDTARTGMITTQALVQGTTDPERALAFLDEFIGNVDAWLNSSIAQVNALAAAEQARINTALAGIAAQQQALQAALAELTSERNAIIAGATQRAQEQAAAANAAAQRIAQAQQAAAQAQIEALQEQLGIAQEFQRVLDQARSMIEQLTFSASNPLGGQARLALLDQEIAAAEARMAEATGADQAAAAARLLELLNQRLQLVQGEGLMQRPGDDYLALYNDTLQRIAGVQAVAEPEADLAILLQQQLNDLQQRSYEALTSIAATVRYTADEQTRLNEIAAAEAAIQAEIEALEAEAVALQEELLEVQRKAEADIAQLQKDAAQHYRWAREEGERLQRERAERLQSQIDTITGGRPIDQFIAERQAESVGLLTTIRDDLRSFLEAISSGAASPGTGTLPGTGPGQGTGPQLPPGDSQMPLPDAPTVHMPTTLNITVASGDPQQIAAAVTTALDTQMPQIATRLKRELDTA